MNVDLDCNLTNLEAVLPFHFLAFSLMFFYMPVQSLMKAFLLDFLMKLIKSFIV